MRQSAIPPRASRTVDYTPDEPDIEEETTEDDPTIAMITPRSAVRYTTTRGDQVIQQGNRRLVIHQGPPPKKRNNPLFYVGIGMLVAAVLWFLLQLGLTWLTNAQLNATYQYPRMYQADEAVGHGDSTDHPTHFIFENLHGQIIIIELPGGDYTHAKIYKGPTLVESNANQIPVTAEFKDVNGDGKVDIILHIQDQRVVFLNDGTQFKEQ